MSPGKKASGDLKPNYVNVSIQKMVHLLRKLDFVYEAVVPY